MPIVPVIIITARPGQARRAADLGIHTFVEKPLDIPILLRTLRELLAHPDAVHLVEVQGSWPTNDHVSSQG